MKRRLLAALAAVLCAAVGAVLLLGYVAGADRRAMAGMETVQVLVAARDVPAGTAAAALPALVTVKTLPRVALAPGAVSDVAALAGLVSTADVAPGEQVLASRFADPATLADAGRPSAPAGTQQVSIRLDPQRVVGGEITPGARVGVFTTIDKVTTYAVRSALVMKIGAPPTTEGSTQTNDGSLQVILAVKADEAQRLVAGAESGGVWFSLVAPAPANTPSTASAAATSQTASVR